MTSLEDSQDESVLLERVFLRLGSADTDDQLQACLEKFLAPVLLKLASPTEGVRKKVMEMLVHVNKRVKSRPLVQLPVAALIQQYRDTSISSFVTNFTIIYIKMGFPRLASTQQVDLLPQLINCCLGRPEPQQSSILQLAVAAFQHMKVPATDEEKKASFLSGLDPNLTSTLLNFLLDFLLLPYSLANRADPSGSTSNAGSGAPAPAPTPPPGLSEASLKAVTGDTSLTPDEIEKIKISVIQILGCGVFSAHSVASHLVVSTADSRHGVQSEDSGKHPCGVCRKGVVSNSILCVECLSVATIAELRLKQSIGGDDWNNPGIIRKLCKIFLGTTSSETNVKPINKRSPAGVPLRLKIFPYLLKSTESTKQFPACVQIVFDCLYTTNSNARLKILAVQFVHHLCLFSPDEQFKLMSSILHSGMMKMINDPVEFPDSKLRSLAYIAVGKISQRSPSLILKDLTLVQKFFDRVSTEDADSKSAIQDSLIMMSSAFVDLDPARMTQMEAIIMQNIEKPDPVSRMMAVRYATTIFPPDHIPSRYALLLACGDVKEDIYTEASKALKVQARNRTEKQADSQREVKRSKLGPLMPPFVDLVAYIQAKATDRLKGPNRYVIGNKTLAFNPGTYIELLQYMRQCLAYSASGDPETPPNMESTASMETHAPSIGRYAKQLLTLPGDSNPVHVYTDITKQLLTALNGSPAMYCLLEIVAASRTKLSSEFSKQRPWIKGFMFGSREDMSQFAAELYAIVTVDCDTTSQLVQVITELTSNLQNQTLEIQLGSILCLGSMIGQVLQKMRTPTGNEMDVDYTPRHDKSVSDVMAKATCQIVSKLDDKHQLSLALAACTALGEIGRNGALPLPDDASIPNGVTKQSLVEKLINKVKSANENPKLRDRAATCLGNLCVGESEFSYRRLIIDGLLDSAAAKQYELHCTIGNALVTAAQGSKSPVGRDCWTCTEDAFVPPYPDASTDVVTLLNLLLDKYIKHANPHIRQAACLWLLSLVKACGDWPEIQADIMKIQSSFVSMLGENDELTQDIVSRGLGVVYEKCGSEQKKELVSSLVDTLTTGKRKKLDVTEDTAVFDEGSLGKTPEGQNMSTYKELCSIANDLNQPDLIYKFMHLANHNATWNARKGAAFGFSTIASQASDQLAPYLDKIVPKLYRYQFDPNARIQAAMSSIWNALVTDKDKTISKYLKEILEDLNKNLTNSQWRIRESSCMALNDLLRGRQLDDVVDELPALWLTCFRVRDDIKESVRNAADVSLKTLSKATIKICDTSGGSGRAVAEKATSLVLPALLDSGLSSPVEEVRAISLSTLMKISRTAGTLLKPHIPHLIVALLESISTLEPQMFNYLSLHVASNEESQEKLDNARMASYKTSPMMDVVNLCIQQVDSSVLPELIPRLTDLIKSGVGLGTKVCCAGVMISVARQCPRDLTPYAGKLLGVLFNGLNDRNVTVRKTNAVAIGCIAKVAKEASVERLFTKINQWYLEKEDETVRQMCGLTIHAINNSSPDVLKAHAAAILPLVFLGMHYKTEKDSNDSVQPLQPYWEEVWLEATPGTEAGIRLYLTEIVEMTNTALTSTSWQMRAQAALSIKTIADKNGSNLGPPHLGRLLTALLAGLPGRTWTGKESLLKALSTICTSCKDALSVPIEGQPTIDDIILVAVKECRKENVRYKMEALNCTSTILDSFEQDRFGEMFEIILPIVKPEEKSESDEDNIDHGTKIELQQCAYESLAKCWPMNSSTQSLFQEKLCDTLCMKLGCSTWKVEVVLLKALKRVVQRLSVFQDSNTIEANKLFLAGFLERLVAPMCQSLVCLPPSDIGSCLRAALTLSLQATRTCVNFSTCYNDTLVAKDLRHLGVEINLNCSSRNSKLIQAHQVDGRGNSKNSSLRIETLSLLEVIVNKLNVCNCMDVMQSCNWILLNNSLNGMAGSDSQPDLQSRAAQIAAIIGPSAHN